MRGSCTVILAMTRSLLSPPAAVLGSALAVLMMKYVRVPSLKHSTVLLVALLVYDVFWVFFSASIFKANVMLEVATKTMDNPVSRLPWQSRCVGVGWG